MSSSRLKQKPAVEPVKVSAAETAQLRAIQRQMAGALFRPLNERYKMQRRTEDGKDMRLVAAEFIKPNDRLTAFERLEIYSRSYWFRLLDCLYDDYPGLRGILGETKFMKLATAYLAKYPSSSYTLRNLGDRLVQFLEEAFGEVLSPRQRMSLDMARFEWAQVIAFDEGSHPAVTPDDLLDARPDTLRMNLQPYITLLHLSYEVDTYLLAVRKRDSDILRSEASNTPDAAPGEKRSRRKAIRLPKMLPVWVAVHRCDNMLYYKRLEPAAFQILAGLREGRTVGEVCEQALEEGVLQGQEGLDRVQKWFANWTELGWFCRR